MSPKIVQVGLLTPARTLDPHDASDKVSRVVAAQIYESPCMTPGEDGRPRLVLLQTLEQTSPTDWTATLRPGLAFSDGTPLTTETAAKALSRSSFIREQATVEARGDRLLFSLRAPNPRFDLALTLRISAVLLEKAKVLLGTGPYLPASNGSPNFLRLVRNPRHRASVAIDEIRFRVFPPDPDGHPAALLRALAQGQVDFTNMLSRSEAAGIPRVRVHTLGPSSTAALFINCSRPGLEDPAVRHAVAMAIDRFALAERSFPNPLAYVATGLLPPAIGVLRDQQIYDLEQARRLLNQASQRPITRLRLATMCESRPYLPNPRATAELVAQQLGGLGLQVQVIVPVDMQEFRSIACHGDYDLLLAGWIADSPDPADYLEELLRSDRVPGPGLPGANYARLASTELDATLARFRRGRGGATESAALQQLLADQMPLVPLLHGAETVVTSWRLKNLELTPWGTPLFGTADVDA